MVVIQDFKHQQTSKEQKMLKKLILTISAGIMTLFLIAACAEDSSEVGTKESTVENIQNPEQADAGVMNQPVDFSTPEAVEMTLQNIREKEGDYAAEKLENVMQYMLVYDLSVTNDKEKLYRKLNGMTPEEIISKMRR